MIKDSERAFIAGYEKEVFDTYNVKNPIWVNIVSHPHFLITGASGSGKSTALKFLLGALLRSNSKMLIFFCDFKNSPDFEFLKNHNHAHYFAGRDCYEGIMAYYDIFTKNRECSKKTNKRHILIFDEYPAFINYLQINDKSDKTKLANDVLLAVSEILMLGRGLRFGIWIVTQRPDSMLFSNGARDNFMVVIALGRLSKEQKMMIFSDQSLPDTVYHAGEGLLLADGNEIIEVKYPLLANERDWEKRIIQVLTRNKL